jgi:transcriptional regulator with XRE-family HTH domain
MANERLRSCLAAAELTTADLAAHIGVDVKTVERWIAKGRVPYRAHRAATATLLRTTEAYLWPDVLDDPRATSTSRAELVTLYPHRGAVPKDLWMRLIEATEDHIDILVYAGLFLPDGHPELAKVLVSKAEQGTVIRMALGDPDSEAVRLRGDEEHIGEGMAARVRLSLAYLDEAIGAPGVELRLHTTTLYNSIYRFDSDMLVNAHAYASPAAQSPVLHLRRLAGGWLFDHYQASFERVWAQARPPAAIVGRGSANGAR